MRVEHLRGKVIGLVVFGLVCLLTFLYLFQLAGGRIRFDEPYNAKALIPDTFNIVPNSDVRKDGVKIGRVTTVEPAGGIGEVNFELEDEDHAFMYRDATVKVRTKTLVGESYLELDPGTPSTGDLPSGATLPVEQNAESVPLERILSSVDEETRKEIRRNVDGIGGGLDGHAGDLNRTFGAMKPTVASGGKLMRVLEPQRRQVAAILENTGEVLEAFGERTAAFRNLVVDAKRTAETAADRDEKIVEFFDELAPTLDQAEKSVNTLANFSGRATPVMRDLKVASRNLTPALRDLGPAARDGRTLFAELEPFLDRVDPLLTELRPAATTLRGLIRPLDAVLRQVNPAVGYLSKYSAEFGSFFSNVGSLTASYDATGARGRVFAMVGPDQFTTLNQTQADALKALVEAGGFQEFYTNKQNSYPDPGSLGNERDFDGDYPRIEADK